jgi:hypothetical protein
MRILRVEIERLLAHLATLGAPKAQLSASSKSDMEEASLFLGEASFALGARMVSPVWNRWPCSGRPSAERVLCGHAWQRREIAHALGKGARPC